MVEVFASMVASMRHKGIYAVSARGWEGLNQLGSLKSELWDGCFCSDGRFFCEL